MNTERRGWTLGDTIIAIILLGVILACFHPFFWKKEGASQASPVVVVEAKADPILVASDIKFRGIEDDCTVMEIQEVPHLVSIRRVKVQSTSYPARIFYAFTDTETLKKTYRGRLIEGEAGINIDNYPGTTYFFIPIGPAQ